MGRYDQKIELRPSHDKLWPLFFRQWEIAFNVYREGNIPISILQSSYQYIMMLLTVYYKGKKLKYCFFYNGQGNLKKKKQQSTSFLL